MPIKRPKRPTPNNKGKSNLTIAAKGKGKATTWESDEDDDDDEAYMTSNDFVTPERRESGTDGIFGDVGTDDDNMLYN